MIFGCWDAVTGCRRAPLCFAALLRRCVSGEPLASQTAGSTGKRFLFSADLVLLRPASCRWRVVSIPVLVWETLTPAGQRLYLEERVMSQLR